MLRKNGDAMMNFGNCEDVYVKFARKRQDVNLGYENSSFFKYNKTESLHQFATNDRDFNIINKNGCSLMTQSQGAFSGKREIWSVFMVHPPKNCIGPRAPPADRPSTAVVFLHF